MCIRAAQRAKGKNAICRSSLLAKTRPPPGWERKILDGSQIFMAHNTKTWARTPDDDARYLRGDGDYSDYSDYLRKTAAKAPKAAGNNTRRAV